MLLAAQGGSLQSRRLQATFAKDSIYNALYIDHITQAIVIQVRISARNDGQSLIDATLQVERIDDSVAVQIAR